jgi:ABC-type sugar transport system permease subunit
MFMKRSKLKDALFLTPGLAVYLTFMLIPLFLTFYYAFTDWDGIRPTYNMVGLDNFRNMLDDRAFWSSLRVTAVVTVVTVLVYNVFGILLAVVLNGNTRARNFAKSALFLPSVLSAVVVAFIWTYMIQPQHGVINVILEALGMSPFHAYASPMTTVVTMSFIITWNSLGFFVVLYVATLSTIPTELFEASKIDGAGKVKNFFYVTLPLVVPGITICSILSVAGGIRQFDHIRVMTGGGPAGATRTVSIYAINQAFEFRRRGYSSAIVIVIFLLIMILTIVQLYISKKREVEY